MTVIPRPASTVVLMDHLNRVYMTKRPNTMKFFGGYYVFPGGAVEESDYKLDSEYINSRGQQDTFDSAYYIAAARELFEEAGVLLVRSPEVSAPSFEEYRRLLVKGEISFWQMLENERLTFDFADLTYFGNLVTPEKRPIRFDTRFFLARLPEGQIPKHDGREVEEASWLLPEDALAESQKGTISIAPPTIIALRTIIDSQNGSSLMMPDLLTAKKLYNLKLS